MNDRVQAFVDMTVSCGLGTITSETLRSTRSVN